MDYTYIPDKYYSKVIHEKIDQGFIKVIINILDINYAIYYRTA